MKSERLQRTKKKEGDDGPNTGGLERIVDLSSSKALRTFNDQKEILINAVELASQDV